MKPLTQLFKNLIIKLNPKLQQQQEKETQEHKNIIDTQHQTEVLHRTAQYYYNLKNNKYKQQ